MLKKLRLRATLRAGLVGLLTAGVLALLPASPASAIQTIAWTTAPPTSVTLGATFSFAWTGRADTFLGARITGCFANFADAPNYTNSFGGNFTTGNCQYTNRVASTSPTYPVTVGFTLSNGGSLTMSWNVAVSAVSPTLMNLPSGNARHLTADTDGGATVPTWDVYGQDGTYGQYGASCTPSAGTVLAAGYTAGSCSATNPAGRTTTQAIDIYVAKGTPTISWTPAAQYTAGSAWAAAMTAVLNPTGLTGTWSYRDASGNAISGSGALPVGTTQVTATFTPSGTTATSWDAASATRNVTVVPAAQVVSFSSPPSTKTYGNAPFAVTAVGTSGGGQVTISAQSGSPCSVASPSGTTTVSVTVTLTGAGTCVLLANQAADGQHTAATQVAWGIGVGRATPILGFSGSGTSTYGASLAPVLATNASVPGAVAFTVNGTPVTATTVLDAGTYTVLATFTPADGANYTTASATRTLTVNRAAAALSVAPIGDTTYGVSVPHVAVTTSSPATRVYSSTSPAVCSVGSGGAITLLQAGTCTVQVAQAATTNYGAATQTVSFAVARATPGLAWPTPADVAYGTALDATQLNAVVDIAAFPHGTAAMGSTVYRYGGGLLADGAVLDAGDHVLTATWTPFADFAGRYGPVSQTVTIHVARATPSLSWATPADVTDGTALGDDQLRAVAPDGVTGTFTYTLDGETVPAAGRRPSIGDHVLHVRFVPDSSNYTAATAEVPLTVVPRPDVPDTLGPGVQHQVDEQRVETQADLRAGETRTFAVSCPTGYLASDGSGRVDAVDQGTGTLADVHVLESRATALDTWTVTLANRATGRAQGKVFADCVQRETSEVDGDRHALVLDDATPATRSLSGSTTVTVSCADGRYPVAPGFLLDGDAVVRRSAADGTSAWTWQVVPTGATPATTGTFSLRCLARRVSTVDGHDHRLVSQQATTHVTVDAGQAVEMQVGCGDLARGIVGGWSLDDGLVLAGAEPRAKTRAVRLFNPTGATLAADLSVQCLETRTEGGSDGSSPVAAPTVTPQQSPAVTSVATSSAHTLVVGARGRTATRVACGSGATGCSGTVALVAARTQRVAGRTLLRGTVLAQARYAVRAGGAARIVLAPTRAGRRVLPAAGLRTAQLRVGGTTRTVRIRH